MKTFWRLEKIGTAIEKAIPYPRNRCKGHRKKAAKTTRSNSVFGAHLFGGEAIVHRRHIARGCALQRRISANDSKEGERDIVIRTCGFERGNLGAQALSLLHSVPGGRRGRAVHIKQRKALYIKQRKSLFIQLRKNATEKMQKGKRLEMCHVDSGLVAGWAIYSTSAAA